MYFPVIAVIAQIVIQDVQSIALNSWSCLLNFYMQTLAAELGVGFVRTEIFLEFLTQRGTLFFANNNFSRRRRGNYKPIVNEQKAKCRKMSLENESNRKTIVK